MGRTQRQASKRSSADYRAGDGNAACGVPRAACVAPSATCCVRRSFRGVLRASPLPRRAACDAPSVFRACAENSC